MKSISLLMLVPALFAATAASAAPSPSDAAITGVLEHHMAAFARHDANDLIKDYADDVVMVFFGQIVQGKKAAFDSFQSHFTTPNDDKFEVHISKVEGDAGVLHWVLNRGQPGAMQGDDVFIIRDGKIRFQATTGVEPLKQ